MLSLHHHHVIIATDNGTIYKVRQDEIPEIGERLEEDHAAVDLVRKTSGGLVVSPETGEPAYYALNCTAFSNRPPAAYDFAETQIEEPADVDVPDLPLLVIPMPDPQLPEEEREKLDETEKVVYLVESNRLRGREWVNTEDGGLLNDARTFVVSALRHGMGVGLFPAVELEEENFIFCYCINCRSFFTNPEGRQPGTEGGGS